jgi:GDP-L-fucose synthase
MIPDSKIYIAGHNGRAGSALWRELQRQSFTNLIGRRSTELDLSDKAEVDRFFDHQRPKYVFGRHSLSEEGIKSSQ